MRPVPTVCSRALGCGDTYAIMGEDALKLSLEISLPTFWYSHVLETNNGGSLLKDLAHRFLTSLIPVWLYVPRYCLFMSINIFIYIYTKHLLDNTLQPGVNTLQNTALTAPFPLNFMIFSLKKANLHAPPLPTHTSSPSLAFSFLPSLSLHPLSFSPVYTPT